MLHCLVSVHVLSPLLHCCGCYCCFLIMAFCLLLRGVSSIFDLAYCYISFIMLFILCIMCRFAVAKNESRKLTVVEDRSELCCSRSRQIRKRELLFFAHFMHLS